MPDTTSAIVKRRAVRFHCFNCLRGELDRLEAAHERDPESIHTSGNWTAGQIVHHLGEVVKRSVDGFEFNAPFPIGLFGPLFRRYMLSRKTMPSGIRLRGGSAVMIPPTDASLGQALADLRHELDRADREKMTVKSPIFGKMTHEDWTTLHLRHAEMHLSFVHYPSGS